MKKRVGLVDTIAAPTCIRFDTITQGAEEKIKLDTEKQIFDANGRPVSITGKVMLLFESAVAG